MRAIKEKPVSAGLQEPHRDSNATPDVQELESLVDVENGVIDRRIFWDDAIYKLELEKIFARVWLLWARTPSSCRAAAT
jgi:hypothetical protein